MSSIPAEAYKLVFLINSKRGTILKGAAMDVDVDVDVDLDVDQILTDFGEMASDFGKILERWH